MPRENYRTRRTVYDTDLYDDEISKVMVSELAFKSGHTEKLLILEFECDNPTESMWLTALDIKMLAKEVGLTAKDFN